MSQSNAKEAIKTLLPLAFDLSAQTLMWNFEAFILGHYSTEALAGVGIASQFLVFLFTSFLTMIMGSTILISRHLGSQEIDKANNLFGQSFILSLISSIVISVAGFFLVNFIFKDIIGLEGLIANGAINYFKNLAFFIPFIVLNFTTIGIIRGSGNSLASMTLNVATHIVNAVLAYGFILGEFNLPQLGASGAAYAVGYAQIFGLFLCIFFLKSSKTTLSIEADLKVVDFQSIKRLLKVGLPITVEHMGWNVAHLVLSVFISKISGVMLAAHQILLRLQQLISMIFQGFGIGNLNLAGSALGAEDMDKEQTSMKISYILATIFAVIAGIAFILGDNWLLSLFSNDKKVIALGTEGIKMLGLVMIPKALCVVTMSALRARGDLNWLIKITWMNVFIVEIGLGALFIFVFDFGLPGLWAVLGLDECIKVLIHSHRLRQNKIRQV